MCAIGIEPGLKPGPGIHQFGLRKRLGNRPYHGLGGVSGHFVAADRAGAGMCGTDLELVVSAVLRALAMGADDAGPGVGCAANLVFLIGFAWPVAAGRGILALRC